MGILYRIFTWFTLKTGPEAQSVPFIKRIIVPFKNFLRVLLSRRIFLFIKVLVLDVLFQARIFKNDPLRWVMHLCIFFGFVMLVLMHALDEIVTQKLFPDYASTLNPYFFLRNFFGIIVLAGAVIAVTRRIIKRGTVLNTRLSDRLAIATVAVIILTGFFLDSAKIVSEPVFDRMMKTYDPTEDKNEIISLQSFWAKEYGVVFKNLQGPFDPALVEKGRELNSQNCAVCHAHPDTAFLSFKLAGALSPAAKCVNKSRADIWLYYIHVLACFLALALLPFTKLFHLITDPLSIIINGVSDKKNPDTGSAESRRALEFDACVNCGTCNGVCSVAPVFRMLGNEQILPSQKLASVRRISAGKSISRNEMQKISEGSFICSGCFKCTNACPAGINLQDQWAWSKQKLASLGHPDPHVWIKNSNAAQWADVFKYINQNQAGNGSVKKHYTNFTESAADTFTACIQCQTCTNVCPVVACSTSRESAVDVTPQKIMNLLRMGLLDLALATRMAWDCTTCFQCQENCPQGIKVTDILYELKNIAYERLREVNRQDALRDSAQVCEEKNQTKKGKPL